MYSINIPGTANDYNAGSDLNVITHHDDGSTTAVLIDGREGGLTVAIENRDDIPVTVTIDGKQLVPAPDIDWDDVIHNYKAFQDSSVPKPTYLLDIIDALTRALGYDIDLDSDGTVIARRLENGR